jgi:heat shock protein HslJ
VSSSSPAAQVLAGTTWRLVRFQSSDDAIGAVVPPRVERYTLAFGNEGVLALGLDCNRGTARWEVTSTSRRGGGLDIKPGPMTRAWCGKDAIDARLARDLADVRSFTLVDGQLSLALKADGGLYVWAPLAR